MYRNSKIVIGMLVVVCSTGGYLLTGHPVGTSPTGGAKFLNQSRRTTLASERRPSEGPGPLLDLASLTRQADLIVVGQIVSVRDEVRKVANEGRGSEGQEITASLNVTRTLKGPQKIGLLEFKTSTPAFDSGYAVVSPKQFGMFFLRSENGTYAVLNPYYPFVIAPHQARIFRGSDLDRVVGEIAYILADRASTDEERRKAVYVLDGARIGLATQALRLATHDADTVVRIQALAALLKRNDISQLNVVEDILLRQPSNIEQYLKGNLAAALDGIQDSRAIPILSDLLAASEVRVRQRAAAALRHMGVADVIAPLVIALNDRDRQVRYEGVVGLAEITRQYEWAPSVELFQKDEQRYVAHWKEWARTQK
jgi:3-isopropylmalate dehydratase small subunit